MSLRFLSTRARNPPIRLKRPADVYEARCILGSGAFAGRDFAPGELILHFSGPEITASAGGRAEAGTALQIGPRLYIDLDSPGAFLNHSCSPNVGVRGLFSAFALRPILCGEELRYDYSTTMSDRRWKMQCACEAPGCRHEIRSFFHLPHATQRRYVEKGIVQAFIVDEWRSAACETESGRDAAGMRSCPEEVEAFC